jgi:hypothetical protein
VKASYSLTFGSDGSIQSTIAPGTLLSVRLLHRGRFTASEEWCGANERSTA